MKNKLAILVPEILWGYSIPVFITETDAVKSELLSITDNGSQSKDIDVCLVDPNTVGKDEFEAYVDSLHDDHVIVGLIPSHEELREYLASKVMELDEETFTRKSNAAWNEIKIMETVLAKFTNAIDEVSMRNFKLGFNVNNAIKQLAIEKTKVILEAADAQLDQVPAEVEIEFSSTAESVTDDPVVEAEQSAIEEEQEPSTQTTAEQTPVEELGKEYIQETIPEPDVAKPTSIDDFDPLAQVFQDTVNENEPEPETQKEEESSEEEDKPSFGVLPNYPKVEYSVNILRPPLSKKEGDTHPERVLFDWAGDPMEYEGEYQQLDRRMEMAQRLKQDPQIDDFDLGIINAAADRVTALGAHEYAYHPDAKWSQAIETPAGIMPLITTIKNPKYGDSKYVGEDAVPLIRNRMKIGVTVGVFLPHTGIYFLIQSPEDGELLNTLSIINTQRVDALRESSGILLGNSNFYLNRQLMNLFYNSITDCSLVSWNRETLETLIDARDFDIVADALQASISPDGYDYVQICGLRKDNGLICRHQHNFVADLKRLIYVDNSRLNEFQRTFALGGLKKRSVAEVREYQEQQFVGYRKAYEITEGIEFVYKSVSAKVAIEAGETWINEISAIVDSLIAFKQDENERNVMINQRIDLTRIREFCHWVAEIVVDGQVLDDPVKINKLLNSMSRNPDVANKVGETLLAFQKESLIGIVAIPRAECPSCQQTDDKDIKLSKHLIPQDAVSRFFTHARQVLS